MMDLMEDILSSNETKSFQRHTIIESYPSVIHLVDYAAWYAYKE